MSTEYPRGGVWVWDYNDLLNDDGDLRLQDGSPAVDIGDGSKLPASIVEDISGAQRTVDFVSINGSNSLDAGAYEKSTECPTFTPADFNIQKSNARFSFTPLLGAGATNCQVTYNWNFGNGKTSSEGTRCTYFRMQGSIMSY
ncbi:MAG TPA: choice-of-anchor Q domain-containing protein [Ohtaekwangia sp.]|nr:choice-of-anchor Q domain-containing protein [Ohtaekwangia sp.]